LQAAIAAVHARAHIASETDWRQIVILYQLLLRLQPSPVVELNYAAAVAMAQGAEGGLKLLDELECRKEMLTTIFFLPPVLIFFGASNGGLKQRRPIAAR